MFQWFQRNLGIREQNACSATGTRGNCVQEWLPLQFLWKARDQARCILRRKDYNKPEFHWPYKFHCKKYQNINKHLIINFSLLKDQERQPVAKSAKGHLHIGSPKVPPSFYLLKEK